LTGSSEKIKKQEELIKKLQNALQVLLDEKEGRHPSNNLKRPNEAFYKEYKILILNNIPKLKKVLLFFGLVSKEKPR
jgi:hypothetical protein